MRFNLHTHTFRCHHASGFEREYIENAISTGLELLGFSEHVPYPFSDGHESSFRLYRRDLEDYFSVLNALREEYQESIKILIGFEAEYYPKYFEAMLRLIAPYKPDYLLMGQHFTRNEEDGVYCLNPTDDEIHLRHYTEQVAAGLSTGKFTYLAHPDLMNYTGDPAIYEKYMTQLCETAKQLQIPLEVNFLGITGHRIYPSERFFRIAAKVGNEIVLGCDAHTPSAMLAAETAAYATSFLSRFGLKPVESIEIRSLY
ncbi:MAG: histidinol-phosphatase [Clostridia bacterium]